MLILASEAPPIVSGIATCICRLATGLADRGHNVRVLSAVQISRMTLGEYRLSSFFAHWPKIARALPSFDVVNVHGPVPTMSDLFLMLASRRPPYLRPAIVYTHHSPIELRGAGRMSARYNRHHEALALRADRVVASSPYYASEHRTRLGPLSTAIPWGVDVPEALAQKPLGRGRLRVLFVGQMRPYKGVETLLAAVAGESNLDVTLVGGGPKLVSYQRLAERLGVANARFTGHLPDADLARQYQESDVIVLPSVTRAEAFGLVLLEGMAAGCVPVASDLPGVRDIAGRTGVVVQPGNEAALREALLELASDPVGLERRREASLYAVQALSWERCVAAYEEVLLDAVRSRYNRLYGHPIVPAVDREAAGGDVSLIGEPYTRQAITAGTMTLSELH